MRPLRVMLVANDGFSAGHVVRMLAIARGLRRRAKERTLDLRLLFATTSEAHALIAPEPLLTVRLPAPGSGHRAGFSDEERRRLVRGALEGAASSFAPDLLVVDTFPSGPHQELVPSRIAAKRVLVRRAVRDERIHDAVLVEGLCDYDVAIIAADPEAHPVDLPIRIVRVPPITLGSETLPREAARAELGLPPTGRVFVVTTGGGGDSHATLAGIRIASAIERLAPDVTVALAIGPLAIDPASAAAAVRANEIAKPSVQALHAALLGTAPRARLIKVTPLDRYLAAFDGAFAAAGYNTAHELAGAGVPAALFAQARELDDQLARAKRFAAGGFAFALEQVDDASIGDALAWMKRAAVKRLATDGADHAASALIDLLAVSP